MPANHFKKERVHAKEQRDFQQEKKILHSRCGVKLRVNENTK
jgi:hypothetical protein